MSGLDAVQLIQDALTQPLQDGEQRRIVFWHDVEGSFGQDFDRLAEDGLGCELARPLVFARVDAGPQFELKRRILRERADMDFLVYTRRPRDFSEGGLEGDWLADIELASEHFQADRASMLLADINAGSAVRDAVARFERFFNSAGRRAAYLKRVPETTSEADVAAGVVSSILKAPSARVEDIVRTYLCVLHEDGPDATLADLERYDALGALSSVLRERIGYAGDLASEVGLSEHLLLSAASCTLPEELLVGYEDHVSAPYARFCLNIVRDWMGERESRETLYEVARTVEAELNIPERLFAADLSSLIDTDVLPCVNEVILATLASSLADGADRCSEALAIRQKRKDLKWYKRVRGYYDLLAAAAESESFYRSHTQAFHAARPEDMWRAYTDDWYLMDAAYRALCTALDDCQLNTDDIPGQLCDAAERLAEHVENIYVNWFLPKSNDCWINCSESDWADRGLVRGVRAQRTFSELYRLCDRGEYRRTMVIIADGMRYEVGCELARRLEQKTKGTVSLDALQSIFPSVTEFGMAALLPHGEISYVWDDRQVLVNGMPTKTTPDREAILRSAVPGARAILSKSLLSGNRAARRELVGDAPLIYVYQDRIDSTGEKPRLEHDVLRACGATVDELVALVKIAVNDLKINRVIVTADHGFIYTRGPLREQDKVSKADIGAAEAQLHRRHILLRESIDNPLFVKVDMRDVHGAAYCGLAPRECIRLKSASGNKNYAHGGVSLQEVCVPVIELRNRSLTSKARVEQEKAAVVLVSTKRRITSSMFHVDLFQRDPVLGKVLPAEYELSLTDGSGNPVTDVQGVHADMPTLDERARVTRPMLTLRAGVEYLPKERYYLVCRDVETGDISWKEEFTIDMAFAPTVDFGL